MRVSWPGSSASKNLSFVSACPQLADGAHNLLSNISAWLSDLVFKRKRGTQRFPQPATLWANNRLCGVILGCCNMQGLTIQIKFLLCWRRSHSFKHGLSASGHGFQDFLHQHFPTLSTPPATSGVTEEGT